MGDGTNRNM